MACAILLCFPILNLLMSGSNSPESLFNAMNAGPFPCWHSL